MVAAAIHHPVRPHRSPGPASAQNWRADVVALFGTDADTDADVKEWVKYSSDGVPHSIPKGDYDLDGDVDAADTDALDLMISGAGGWNLDFNRDGNLDQDDVDAHAAYRTAYSGGTGGRGVQTRTAIDNTLGYAGYVWDGIIGANHVRHRVYLPSLGRWTKRDPNRTPRSSASSLDESAYDYVGGNPLARLDPQGLAYCLMCCGGPGSGCCNTCGQEEPPIAVDSAEMRCWDVLPFPASARHCYVKCCKPGAAGGPPDCKKYALHNVRGKATCDTDVEDIYGRPPEKEVIVRGISQPGICECLSNAIRLNPCGWRYSKDNCNSNWYANTLWQCCIPGAPTTIPDAHGDVTCCCSRTGGSGFICPLTGVGAGGNNCCTNSRCSGCNVLHPRCNDTRQCSNFPYGGGVGEY